MLFVWSFLLCIGFFLLDTVYSAWTAGKGRIPFGQLKRIFFWATVAIGLMAMLQYYFVYAELKKLADAWHVRHELALAFTLLASALIGILTSRMFSPNPKRRQVGVWGFASVMAVYFVLLWMGVKDNRIGHCVYFDEEGVRWYESQENDVRSGKPCVVLTQDNEARLRPILRKLQNGDAPRLLSGPPFFVNTINGPAAVAWVFRRSTGEIEVWDMPGSHPTFGKPLQEMTPEIAEEWNRQQQTASTPKTQKVDPVASSRGRYLVQTMQRRSGDAAIWAVVGWDARGIKDRRAWTAFTAQFHAAGLNASDSVFSEAFVTDGLADDMLLGSNSSFSMLGLSEVVDYVFLIKVEEHSSPPESWRPLWASRTKLQLRMLRVVDGRSTALFHAEGRSEGHDQTTARDRAMQLALNELQATLPKKIAEVRK
ncbi:MAG: hypothetical protein ACT4NL_06025 [Pseudomarimonas sp.]